MTWSLPYPVLTYVVAAIAAVALLYLARRWAISKNLKSLWFFIPRALVLGAVLAVLLNPVEESARELPPSRPQVACLVDSSRSMGLDEIPRLEEAKDFVYRAQEELDYSKKAELQLYQFGQRITSIPSLAEVAARDDESALSKALSDLQGFLPDAESPIVIVSDGQIGDVAELEEVAKQYKALGIPVHVYPVGANNLRGDVAIERLSIPRKVKANDQAPVRVTVRSQGYNGQRVELQVVASSNPNGKPVATLPITLKQGSQSYDVVVPADPKAGELVLSVPLQKNEAIENNNSVPFELIARDRKMKVFYMEGTQGTEYRYIRDALQDDPNITCVSAVVDNQYSSRPRLSRVDDPYKGFPASREELFEFDVVICSDISKGAFTREQLEWTTELVRDRGGGFIMIGGYTSFGAGNWDQTVWDQLIPIDMRGGNVGRGVVNQQFNTSVPAKVRTHPIWRLSEDQRKNDQIIDAIPPFFGTNIAKRVKPAATLLAVSASRVSMAGKSPVFACQSYGKGRTFAMLPDSTVSWGSAFERNWGDGDNRYFRKFWRNVVNWLTENSVSGDRRLVVHTDKLIYRPGEPIQFSVQAFDEQMKATKKYRVEVLSADDDQSKQVLRPTGAAYTGELKASLPAISANEEASTLSELQLKVVSKEGNKVIATQEVTLQVLNDSDELLTPNANRKVLEKLAEWTDGEVLKSSDELIDALADLQTKKGQRVVYQSPSWDKPWVWFSMLGLVVSEWIMRRRSR